MKKKIINDPVYGFLNLKSELIYRLVEHPYFQRLRRIGQLGLTSFVYPGALHTRFHHALGAMHLMSIALDTLRKKGHFIFDEEYEAALIAILLHDIGHGPFSHALESTILRGVHHEKLSLMLMEELNQQFDGRLGLAIRIFKGEHHRHFLHQLVSSQLDMDRLDYLQRDCFFTGVKEGSIGADRLIQMLDLHEDRIVLEEKAIYSVENFLTARRLMYWQVYLHKTTVSTEQMLIQLIKRAKYLVASGVELMATPSFNVFLKEDVSIEKFLLEKNYYLKHFALLDDHDIWGSMKFWQHQDDKILKELSRMILNRETFKVDLSNEPFEKSESQTIIEQIIKKFQVSEEEVTYLFTEGSISNSAYLDNEEKILIKTKKGEIVDITKASDLPSIEALSKSVTKFYRCYPKSLKKLY
ncbi:MAG: HD domain-containing protein [Flammeovirgaceae bacterium]